MLLPKIYCWYKEKADNWLTQALLNEAARNIPWTEHILESGELAVIVSVLEQYTDEKSPHYKASFVWASSKESEGFFYYDPNTKMIQLNDDAAVRHVTDAGGNFCIYEAEGVETLQRGGRFLVHACIAMSKDSVVEPGALIPERLSAMAKKVRTEYVERFICPDDGQRCLYAVKVDDD